MKTIYEKVLRMARRNCEEERFRKIALFCKYKLGQGIFTTTEFKSYYKNGKCFKIDNPKITGKVVAKSFKEFLTLSSGNLEVEKRVYF